MSDLPFDFFCSELNTGEPQRQLQAVSRMRVICLALGPERTRKHLLTFLQGEMELGKYMDEVLVAIAYNLGRCVEFIGPMSELPCLLKPLEWMCNIEETTVRDEAVASLNLIGKQMEPEQIKAEFLPIVLSLAKHMEWFTPRVSASGLFPLAMQKLGGDAAASQELRDGFKQLGDDETPMVRRAAALQLSDFAKAVGEGHASEDLLPLYQKLLSDEQDSVRVNALKSSAAIIALAGGQRLGVLKDYFKKCVGDKSWRVRVACAEAIAEVGAACVRDAEALAEVKEIYGMLQRDHEAEVRIATALRAAGVTAALGADFGREPVFPILKELVLDPNSIQRIELAAVLMDMAAPLGKAQALELVFPTAAQLLEAGEENNNVRLLMIGKLHAFVEVVGITDERGEKRNGVVGLVGRLCQDKNWRVRHSTLTLFPKLAAAMGEADFSAEFAGQEAGWATDNCALIRTDWAKTIGTVAARFEDPKAWLAQHVLPVLEERKAEKSFQLRAVLLEGASTLAPLLDVDQLQAKLCPSILEMCDDKVPNLRIDAVKCCRSVGCAVGEDWRERILTKLREKAEDEDPDVKFFANDSIAAITAS